MMKCAVCAACAIAFMAAACGGGDRTDRTAIPRRPAYPRVNLYPAEMDTLAVGGVRFAVNRRATATQPRPDWLNVEYPRYGATLHATFTAVTPASAPEAIANRLERMALNGGEPVAEDEWVADGGFRVYLVRTRGSQTPLQFIACDSATVLVSGTVFFSDPGAARTPDSIAPMVDAINNDIVCALNSLAESQSTTPR